MFEWKQRGVGRQFFTFREPSGHFRGEHVTAQGYSYMGLGKNKGI